MKKVPLSLVFAVLILVGLSCRLADRFAGGDDNLKRGTELWSDVPKMDSLAESDMEMPFAIKVILRTVLNNLWRLNDKNEDQTPVAGDWIAFSTPNDPADIRAFYTNDRMTSFGNWEASKKSTCLDPKDSNFDGALCVFQKITNGKDTKLAIIAMKDDTTKTTNVFFLRLEEDAKPGAANTNSKVAEKEPIRPLVGAAPYGIEKRPMPSGVDLETLLPKQVGPYQRVLVERSDRRGETASEAPVDGNSVYATYKNGEKEIFVELGVNAKAEEAQASMETAADEGGGGVPADPKLGSIGTEPSFAKISGESGSFFTWTRRGYFFSASAKGGAGDLDAFMNAFPY